MPVLSQKDLEFFNRHGYFRVKQAFPREIALAVQDEIWAELYEQFGIDRSDRHTWRVPPKSPKRAKHSPLNEQVASPRFREAIDDLLGAGTWAEPANWGGFLITFPIPRDEPWEVSARMWHWDFELSDSDSLAGLLIFTFFSQVPPHGGGTLILSGSHHVLRSYYHSIPTEQRDIGHAKHRKCFLEWHPWIAALAGRKPDMSNREAQFMKKTTEVAGFPTQVVELTGEPGDAVFCHPWMLHTPSGQNHNDQPRFMRGKFFRR